MPDTQREGGEKPDAPEAPHLPGYIVEKVAVEDGALVAYARVDVPPVCAACGTGSVSLYGQRARRILDTPENGLRTVLHLRLRRCACRGCGGVFTERAPLADARRAVTSRLAHWVWLRAREHTAAAVARMTGLSETSVRAILRDYATASAGTASRAKSAK